MTPAPEQIAAKTNEELDALAAELMGWEHYAVKDRLYWRPQGQMIRRKQDWSPSTKIADAWELEESLPSHAQFAYTEILGRLLLRRQSRATYGKATTLLTWSLVHAPPRLRTEACCQAFLALKGEGDVMLLELR